MTDSALKLFYNKSKGAYLKTEGGIKFYDLSSVKNLNGYSNSKLTKYYKNYISTSWNIKRPTRYIKRFLNIFPKETEKKFKIYHCDSIEHFYFFIAYNFGGIHTNSRSMSEKLKTLNIKDSPDVTHYDMTYYLLRDQKPELHDNKINIADYYYYPEITPADMLTDKAIIVLPSLLSGYNNDVFILVPTKHDEKIKGLKTIDQIDSIKLAHSIDFFNLSLRNKNSCPVIKNNLFIQKNRLFSISENISAIEDIHSKLSDSGIIINNKPPYYSYFPAILDENQTSYLEEVLNGIS